MTFSPRMFVRRAWLATVVGVAALGSVSCGEVARTGQSPAFLIIDALEGASGADPAAFGTVVASDVITLVQVTGQTARVPTVFADPGRVALRLGLRNPGSSANPTSPSTLNAITISRYRVQYRRSDGRNVPGVDVPYGFDGAFTATVSSSSSLTAGFDLVRVQAKLEPPLKNLVDGGAQNVISTIAEVTFFGRDQAGNEVAVSGSISVNFSDYGDPS
jgi:hypothetical protein